MSDYYSSLGRNAHGIVRYVRALRTRWKLIVGMAVIAVASAAFFSYTAEDEYRAHADLLVTPLAASDDTFQGFSLFRQTFEDSSSVVTATRIFSSPVVYGPAFDSLGEDRAGATVGIQPLGQANIVTIEATAPDAEQAARVANGFARHIVGQRTRLFQAELTERIKLLRRQVNAFPAQSREGNFEYTGLQQQLADFQSRVGTPDPTVQLLTEASVPGAPSWPRPRMSMAMALLAALVLGGGIALLLELASPRITSEEELQLDHRLPILARIPRISPRVARAYLTGRGSLPGPVWKGYRVLRAVLANLGPDRSTPRSILVTSSSPGDGKTTTAVNLAITLAASNARVVLVDGDLHRPMVATVFNVPIGRDGMTRALANRSSPEDVLVPAPGHPRLSLLLSSPNEYGQLGLRADRFKAMIEELLHSADVVVIDSPPVPEVAEVLEMAESVDVVITCVRLGHTRRDRLAQLQEMFARRAIVPAGFVVTTRSSAQRETEYDYPGDLPSPTTRRRAVVSADPPERSVVGLDR